MANQKNKKISKIADELDALSDQYHDPSLKEIAAQLRKAVTSGKANSNEQSETNEDDTGGSNPPPGKGPRPDKP